MNARVTLHGGPGDHTVVTVPIPPPEHYFLPVQRRGSWSPDDLAVPRPLQSLIAIYTRTPDAGYVYTTLC